MQTFDYNYINKYNSAISPSTLHCENTALVNYYKKYLMQKILSRFVWNVPEHWDMTYFQYVLFCKGFISVVKTDKFGIIPQMCSLYGFNVFYAPTKAVIANPLIRNVIQPTIGEECEIIKIAPDYSSPFDIVTYYADLLALCSEASEMNIVNSKLATVFFAENKAIAESYKKMYDTIMAGNTAVVIDNTMKNGNDGWAFFNRDVKNSYILSDLLSDMRKIEMMFDTTIGIRNANTDKKERLISAEVDVKGEESQCLLDLWLSTLKDGCKKVNALFGLNIDVEKRGEEE